jgi:hypothetical protein
MHGSGIPGPDGGTYSASVMTGWVPDDERTQKQWESSTHVTAQSAYADIGIAIVTAVKMPTIVVARRSLSIEQLDLR